MDNIKVAVRCRPFNDREKKLNSRCVLEMVGGTTILDMSKVAGTSASMHACGLCFIQAMAC